MILVGNQRGGAKNLALHLLKEENDHVEVHELRGFASENLVSALNEAYAISQGTKCRQFLFSLSFNPPPGQNVKTEAFEKAIDEAEARLGLSGQPRAIVFHEKEGRRHAHAVWSRIDSAEMKAIPLPFTKLKLRDLSRELFLEHGWPMPRGLMNSQERDLRNFSLAEWQQAKRMGKDPCAVKAAFQDCWAVSDTQAAFRQALKERGYILARGDRRGFVALDFQGEVFSVSRWVGIRTKDVRARLKDQESLPSVAQAKSGIARNIAFRLRELEREQRAVSDTRKAELAAAGRAMAREHQEKRRVLDELQQYRWQQEARVRQSRLRPGMRGVFDRLTGQRRRIREQNEREAWQALLRDRQEKDALIFDQLEQRRAIKERVRSTKTKTAERTHELRRDISEVRDRRREALEARREDLQRLRQRSQERRPARRRNRDMDFER